MASSDGCCFCFARGLSCCCLNPAPSPPSPMSMEVGVLCLSGTDTDSSLERWVKRLGTEVRVSFHRLLSSDLNNFQPPADWTNVRAVILLHSVEKSGRLSLTDLKEARYDRLLQTLREAYGKLILSFPNA